MTVLFAVAGASSASANVIFTFRQTGMASPAAGTPQAEPTVFATMALEVTDEAYATGLNLQQGNSDGVPPHADLPGLVSLRLNIDGIFRPVDLGLDDFMAPLPYGTAFATAISLLSNPEGLMSGQVYVNTFEHTFRLFFDGTVSAHGTFATDSGGGCFFGPPYCTFSGSVTTATATVPEPASIALFGTGLLGLGMLHRRRRRHG